jgi:hypothetical protein
VEVVPRAGQALGGLQLGDPPGVVIDPLIGGRVGVRPVGVPAVVVLALGVRLGVMAPAEAMGRVAGLDRGALRRESRAVDDLAPGS